MYNAGDVLNADGSYYVYPAGGDVGGDPQIHTLSGEIYTVPDYLRVFDYVRTPNTTVRCTTKILTQADFPEGVKDHNGKERVNLGPFTSATCPHTYMDTIHIHDQLLGELTIEMDTLRVTEGDNASKIVVKTPQTATPMRTPLRSYPLLETTKEIILELTDLTLHLWSDTTVLERHNIRCTPHVPYNQISGAIVQRPLVKLEGEVVLNSTPMADGTPTLNINGMQVPYDIGDFTGPIELLNQLLSRTHFVTA